MEIEKYIKNTKTIDILHPLAIIAIILIPYITNIEITLFNIIITLIQLLLLLGSFLLSFYLIKNRIESEKVKKEKDS